MAAVAAILLVTAAVAYFVVRDRSSLRPQLTQSGQDTRGKGVIAAAGPLEEARQKLDLSDPIKAVTESASGARKFLAQQNSRDVSELKTGDEAMPEDATVDTVSSIPGEPASKPNEIDRGSAKSLVPQESNQDNITGLNAKAEMHTIVTEPKEVTVPINSDTEQTLPGGTESIERQVTGLLARAERQIAAQHLTTPAGDAALETYQSILELVPEHSGALHGIARIKQLYLAWADTARQRGELKKAQSYAERAATVDPQDSDVVQLLDQIKAERKLEAQRAVKQIEEPRAPTDDEEETPVPRTNKRRRVESIGIFF
jgi:tetratricopeptide (TPR) repeat protein